MSKINPHALMTIMHEWQTVLDRGGAVRSLFVDFRKTFDSVNHNILLHKLYARHIAHCLIKWFFSYLDSREQHACIGMKHSSWVKLNGGMPQGSWLGPLTFLLLIGDLVPICLIHKYVDDTTLTEILQHHKDSLFFSSY